MSIYFTSDLHIGHKLVAGLRGFFDEDNVVGDDISCYCACHRDGGATMHVAPCCYPPEAQPDTQAHDEHIAHIWDKTVKSGDTVYILGDTGMSRFDEVVLPWFKARKGIKHLIAGNHDPVHPARSDSVKLQARKWLDVFDTINPYTTKRINGEKVLLSHFPYAWYGDGDTHGEPGEGRWAEWRLPDTGKFLVHGHTHGQERDHGSMFHVGWDAWGQLVPEQTLTDWIESKK